MKDADAGVLSITYNEEGDLKGHPVLLLHGFPYDVHTYDEETLCKSGVIPCPMNPQRNYSLQAYCTSWN
jgi:pimeloyl-ACP methyl ester carboxylesterase